MKTIHLSIITGVGIVSLVIFGIFVMAHPSENQSSQTVPGIRGTALFMESNSTGKIYANFTFPELNNKTWNISSGVYASINDGAPITIDSKNMTITAEPNSFTGEKNNVIVTYTITAKNNTKGVYALFLYFCGLSPIVVGLNESEVNPVIFDKFFTAFYECPAGSEDMPTMKIVGYSGIISKTISINSASMSLDEIKTLNDSLINRHQNPNQTLKAVNTNFTIN